MFSFSRARILSLSVRAVSPISETVITPVTTQLHVASMKILRPVKTFDDVRIPEKPRIQFVAKVPNLVKSVKEPRNIREIYLPEEVEIGLEEGQYGIKATRGGYMKFGHFEMVRKTLNKRFDSKKVFAKWRIEAPYKPVTKKGQGVRMGSGKGSINHYVTPVKPERIIFEVWGKVEFAEVVRALEEVRGKLPFAAKVVSTEILQRDMELEKLEIEENQNPWTFERIAKGNFLGINKYLSPYDHIYYGKYYG